MAAILVFGTSKISCVCLSKNPDSSLIDVYSLGGLSKMGNAFWTAGESKAQVYS